MTAAVVPEKKVNKVANKKQVAKKVVTPGSVGPAQVEKKQEKTASNKDLQKIGSSPKASSSKTPPEGADPSASPKYTVAQASINNPLKIKLKTGQMSPLYSATDVMKSPAR